MEPSKLVKSIFWLTSLTGLGYILLKATTYDQEKLAKDYRELDQKSRKTNSKNEQFVNVIQAAAKSDQPLYRLTKEEIDKAFKK